MCYHNIITREDFRRSTYKYNTKIKKLVLMKSLRTKQRIVSNNIYFIFSIDNIYLHYEIS